MSDASASTSSQGCCSWCFNPEACLVSKLWKPLQVVAYSPIYTVVGVLVVYLLFLILFLPFLLLSYLVTSTGSTCIFFGLIVLGCRAFARSIAFAGSSKTMHREIAMEYMKRTNHQIEHFCAITTNFAVLVANSDRTRQRLNNRERAGTPGGNSSTPLDSNSNTSDANMSRKGKELYHWVGGMMRLNTFIEEAMEDYKYYCYSQTKAEGYRPRLRSRSHSHSDDNITTSPMYAKENGNTGAKYAHSSSSSSASSHSDAGFIKRSMLGNFIGKSIHQASEYLFGNKSKQSKEQIDTVINPVIVVHNSFTSLLEQASKLCSLVLDTNDQYADKYGYKSSFPQAGSAKASPGEVGELVASISLCIRFSEALRNSSEYMMQQSSYDEIKTDENANGSGNEDVESGGGNSDSGSDTNAATSTSSNTTNSTATGDNNGVLSSAINQLSPSIPGLSSLLRINQGPKGPSILSFFMMRSQLRGDHRAFWFDVEGEDTNTIDCMYFTARDFNKGLKAGDDPMYDDVGFETDSATEEDEGSDFTPDGGDYEGERSATPTSTGNDSRNGCGKVSYKESDNKDTLPEPLTFRDNYEENGKNGEKTSLLPSKEGTKYKATHRDIKINSPDSIRSNRSNASSRGRQRRRGPHHAGSSNWGGAHGRPSVSSVGTVLFCGPNAGMYEVMAMAAHHASWLGYYTKRGLDVCYFNYRGYSLSSGVATPTRACMDGSSVMKYLRDELGVKNIILHGESIGGLVANKLAYTYTQGTLPGVGVGSYDNFNMFQQGGNTDEGMSLIGGTADSTEASSTHALMTDMEAGNSSSNTESGNNNNTTTTSSSSSSSNNGNMMVKMLICDRTFASLDSIAARLLGQWAAYGLVYLGCWTDDCVYRYLNSNVPMKCLLQDNDDMVIHHQASLKVGISTSLIMKEKNWYPLRYNRDYHMANATGVAPTLEESALEQPFQLNEAFVEALYTSLLSLMQQAQRKSLQMCNGTRSGGNDDDDTSYSLSSNTTNVIRRLMASIGNSDGGNINRDSIRQRQGTMSSYRPTMAWLTEFCKRSIDEDNKSLCALEKVCLVLLRIDGYGGQVLGQALMKGYDAVRGWMCTLLTWHSKVLGSTARTSDVHHLRRSIFVACDEFDRLWEQQQKQDTSQSFNMNHLPGNGDDSITNNSIVQFLKNAMYHLRDRIVDREGTATPFSTPDHLERHTSNLRGNNGTSKGLFNKVLGSEHSGVGGTGVLLPVTCGHSGWPNKRSLEALEICILEAGLPITPVLTASSGVKSNGGEPGVDYDEKKLGDLFPKATYGVKC